jgi:hypothetical protein
MERAELPSRIPAHTLRRTGQSLLLFVCGSTFALLGVGMVVQGSDPVSTSMGVAAAAGGGWCVFRSCLLGVRIDHRGLTERGLGRSVSVPWCAIQAVEPGASPGPAPAAGAAVLLKSGERVGLGALASYSGRTLGADLALIRALHSTHAAECPACA